MSTGLNLSKTELQTIIAITTDDVLKEKLRKQLTELETQETVDRDKGIIVNAVKGLADIISKQFTDDEAIPRYVDSIQVISKYDKDTKQFKVDKSAVNFIYETDYSVESISLVLSADKSSPAVKKFISEFVSARYDNPKAYEEILDISTFDGGMIVNKLNGKVKESLKEFKPTADIPFYVNIKISVKVVDDKVTLEVSVVGGTSNGTSTKSSGGGSYTRITAPAPYTKWLDWGLAQPAGTKARTLADKAVADGKQGYYTTWLKANDVEVYVTAWKNERE